MGEQTIPGFEGPLPGSAVDNLGVVAPPSREEHAAALDLPEAKAIRDELGYTPLPALPVAAMGADGFPTQARKALAISEKSGLGPEHVIQDMDEAKFASERDQLEIDLTPVVREWASQSAVHAQAVADDAGNLGALERMVTGNYEGLKAMLGRSREEYENDPANAPPESFTSYFLGRGVLGTWADLKGFWLHLTRDLETKYQELTNIPLTPEKQQEIKQSRDELRKSIGATEQAAAELQPPEGTNPNNYVGRVIEAGPGLVGIVGASLAGPEGTFLYLFGTSAGRIYRELDKDPSFTEDDKASVAGAGGVAAAIVGGNLGSRFIGSLIPKALMSETQAAAARVITDSVVGSKIWGEILKDSGRHMVSGTLLNVGLDLSESLALEFARAHSEGRTISSSVIMDSIRRGIEGGLVLAPYGVGSALAAHAEGLGRWANSQSDAVRLRASVAAAAESRVLKELPQQGQLMIRKMPGERTVWVDASAYEGAGGEPPPGSRTAGTAVPVAREDFLIAGGADKLLDQAKLDPNGLTPRELSKEAERLSAERILVKKDLSQLMAERDFVTANEPDTPGRRARLDEINAQMRHAAVTTPLPEEAPPQPGPPEGMPAAEYAREEAAARTIGEFRGLQDAHARAAASADSGLQRLQESALKSAEKSIFAGQVGIEAGISAAEHGRESALMNMQFARTARFREWLKGLVITEKSQSVVAKDEQGVERWRTETGLYDVPGINVQVEKPLAEKWRLLGEAQRRQAIGLFKASEKSQGMAEDKYVKSTILESQAGDAAAEARTYRRARDVARALMNEYRRGLDASKKIATYVGNQSSVGIRETMYQAGEKYGAVYDGVLNSLGIGKRREGGPAADVDRIILEGDEIPNAQFLKELIAKPRSFEDLTLPEARGLQDSMRALRRAARDATRTELNGRSLERDASIAIMGNGLEGITKPGQFVYGEVSDKQRREAELSNPEVLLAPFKEFGDDWNSRRYKSLHDESDLQQQYLPSLKIPKELEKLGDKPVQFNFFERTGRLRFVPKVVKLRDVWRLAAMVGNESGMQKAARGYGVTPMRIEDFLQRSMTTRAEWDHVVGRWAANESLYALEQEVHARRNDVPAKKLEPREISVRLEEDGRQKLVTFKGGYDPFRWYDGRDGEPPPLSAEDPYRGNRRHLDTPHPFMEGRVQNFYSVPDPRHDNLRSHYLALMHDITFSDLVRDLHRTFYNNSFKDMVRDRLGDPHYQAMLRWLETTAVGHIVDQGRGLPYYDSLLARNVRGLAAQAAFSYNPPVIAGQAADILHLMPSMGIGPQHVASAVGRIATSEGWAEPVLKSDVVSFRNVGYREKLNTILAETLRSSRMPHLEALNWASHEAYHFMDTFTSRLLWTAKKIQVEHDYPHLGEAFAVREADRAVARGMPPLDVTSQSAFAQSRLWGLLILVRNFPNTLWNLKAMMKWESRIAIDQGANPFWTEAARYGRLIGLVGALGFGSYLMGQGKREKETYTDWLVRTALQESVRDKPLLYPAVQALAPYVLGQQNAPQVNYFDTPLSDFANRLSTDIGRLANRNRPLDKKMFDVLDFAGRLIGPPLTPSLVRSGQAAYKTYRYYMLGYNDFRRRPTGGLDIASSLFYGERRGSTPLTDVQKWLGQMRWNRGGGK